MVAGEGTGRLVYITRVAFGGPGLFSILKRVPGTVEGIMVRGSVARKICFAQ